MSASSTQFTRFRLDSHSQRIQRLMRAATRPEPVRKAFEVHLINLIEDGHHGLLNNLVLQRRDAQRTLPPVGLRYIDSPRGLCPIRSTVNPAVQIGEPILQSGLILLPRHAIHSRRSLPLQGVKAVPEQTNRQMVEQSGEPFLLPFLCCLPHTAQSLGHSFPALCRARVGLSDVLLGPRPSLPNLRRGLLPLCSAGSSVLRRSPTPPERACPHYGFAPSRTGLDPGWTETLRRSPGSRACCFSACAGS